MYFQDKIDDKIICRSFLLKSLRRKKSKNKVAT
jgi:hypothetical protein